MYAYSSGSSSKMYFCFSYSKFRSSFFSCFVINEQPLKFIESFISFSDPKQIFVWNYVEYLGMNIIYLQPTAVYLMRS